MHRSNGRWKQLSGAVIALRTGVTAHGIALLLALAAGLAVALAPVTALAQAAAVAAPRIDGFDVEPVARLATGRALVFTLYGSAGGTATLRIEGGIDRFALDEVEAGVYEGTYTIRSRDRLTARSLVTANLRAGNRIATEVLDESLLTGAATRTQAARADAAAAVAAKPRIDRFEAGPAAALSSGTDLFFTVVGSPGASASVRIAGVKGKLALAETPAGTYEGIYTIKDRDRVSATSAATAVLRLGGSETSATLGESLLSKPGALPSARRAPERCANCGIVESINVVEVNGPGSYVGKIAGGVVGAVLGSQIGSGRGTTAAEVVGAVGGAVAGNEIEKRVRKSRHWDVVARLAGGGTQTSSFATEPAFKVGDRVRLEGGTLVAN